MAIIEVVFPQLKKDADSVKAALEKLPVAHRAFREGGATRGSQGFMVSENGKDTTSDFREVVMLGKLYFLILRCTYVVSV